MVSGRIWWSKSESSSVLSEFLLEILLMSLRPATFFLLCGLVIPAAMADVVSCPDLSVAVQVASCPTEEDLKFTFNGYCSDNKRMYEKDTDVCTDYQRYKALKNVALWESGDGAFQAYVSCDLPVPAVKAAKISSIAISRNKGISRLVCEYREGVVFTNRVRAECKFDESTNCSVTPSGCKVICE
jgi:hypothetical protein